MLTKFLLLIVLLIIACVFAIALLFRLIRTSQQIGDLHKKLAVNDFELNAKIDALKGREGERAGTDAEKINDEKKDALP